MKKAIFLAVAVLFSPMLLAADNSPPALVSGSSPQTGAPGSITTDAVTTVYWVGSGTSGLPFWSDYTNFTSDPAGTVQLTGSFGFTQNVVFSGSNATNQGSNFLDQNMSARSLTISDPAGVDIGGLGSNVLMLAGNTGITGITVTSAAGSTQAQIAANVDLAGTPNVTVNNSGGLLISGQISGSNGLIVNGTGMLTVTDANPFTGGTELISGTLNASDDNNFGVSGAGNGVTFNPGGGNSATLQSGANGFTSAPSRSFAFLSGTGIIDPGPAGNAMTISGTVSGPGVLEVVDKGQLILSGSESFTGTANVTSGTLTVNGSMVSSAGITVSAGATLSGSGRVGAVSGAGLIAPGDPQILTASQIDPGSGMSFDFHFSQLGSPIYTNAAASGNDVLHLTGATPFKFALTSANTITLDFTGQILHAGQIYYGGFFTDTAITNSMVNGATFEYTGLNGADVQYEGLVPVSNAGFATGTVSGDVMEFEVIPEPSTWAMLAMGGAGLLFAAGRRIRA